DLPVSTPAPPFMAITRLRLAANTVPRRAATPFFPVRRRTSPWSMRRGSGPQRCATPAFRAFMIAGAAGPRAASAANPGFAAARVIRRPRVFAVHGGLIGPLPHALVAEYRGARPVAVVAPRTVRSSRCGDRSRARAVVATTSALVHRPVGGVRAGAVWRQRQDSRCSARSDRCIVGGAFVGDDR